MSVSSCNVHPKFICLFKDTFGFSTAELEHLLDHFEVKHLRKKEFYVKPGVVCDFKAYINKGCMRTFTMDPQGHERIILLPYEDWWVSDIGSYYSGQLSTTFVQAIEDCELLEITKANFQKLEKEIPKLSQWYTVKLARRAVQSMKNQTEAKATSLEDSYLKLLETQPEIFQRLPLQYIASYLNVEPQSLSRMRKRLMKDP
jgi:CRP-like cAMP-binding protein